MVQVPEKTITLGEFLKLPETTPASECIHGQVTQKPMPQGKHSIIQGELVTVINAVAKKQRVAHAFPEWRCTFGGRSIVPDVSVFAWKQIPVESSGDIANFFPIYPDWTIEILVLLNADMICPPTPQFWGTSGFQSPPISGDLGGFRKTG